MILKFFLAFSDVLFAYVLFSFHNQPQAMQASNPLRFQSLMQTLDFHYQALANGVAQHAEQRKIEIEKEKLEKASAATPAL